ncbi:MAG: hypothetical protein UY21_C0002G0039 [Microgenomates group bacterium GW2011_GWA1_48_10]|uniref:Uncharacterized protein n=1 Tax=Candidatus Gottesmanbacteria bacterium RIFCSPHIGHO2_01_FULL_47_48 TaxID=1798381 RepID=A0A1F5ZZA9_9BACT|nr:MAG: hypothetical protein UY21_C0002G0039 [Microgenomates group bacterium GW2011_GWA1_48_10]OGG17791.1 MAG: hypothetical protein A2721_02100 [Candidatus Gottesmanbacteria bacterium RIFCSPHIGHO2_01_FULL_47_48]
MNFRKGNIALVFLPILLVAFIGVGGYLYWQKQNKAAPSLAWEECLKTPGATATYSYPGTCSTPDGRNVIQPLIEEEKNNLQPPEDIVGWKTYTNTKYGYQIKYPDSWSAPQLITPCPGGLTAGCPGHQAQENSTGSVAFGSFDKIKPDGITLSVREGFYGTLDQWVPKISDGSALRKTSTVVDGVTAYKLSENSPKNDPNSFQYWLYFIKNKAAFEMISTPGFDGNDFDQILSAFKFIDQAQSQDSCQTDNDCPVNFVCERAGGTTQCQGCVLPKNCWPKGHPPLP